MYRRVVGFVRVDDYWNYSDYVAVSFKNKNKSSKLLWEVLVDGGRSEEACGRSETPRTNRCMGIIITVFRANYHDYGSSPFFSFSNNRRKNRVYLVVAHCVFPRVCRDLRKITAVAVHLSRAQSAQFVNRTAKWKLRPRPPDWINKLNDC